MPTPFFQLAPVVLDDAMFFKFNPSIFETGTASARQAAYLMAEQGMVQYLTTPLLPTQVSGTYLWPVPQRLVTLDFCRVISIDALSGNSLDNGCNCNFTKIQGCGIIRSYYGYLDPRIIQSTWLTACSCSAGSLYSIDVTYTAGLPTGVAAGDMGLQMGLAKVANIYLLQIVNPGAAPGGPGNPGVKSWSAQGYSQTNVDQQETKYTPWGMSAEAAFAAQCVRHLRILRPMGLHG